MEYAWVSIINIFLLKLLVHHLCCGVHKSSICNKKLCSGKPSSVTAPMQRCPAPGILSREARTSGNKRLGGFIVTGMHTEERQRGALESVLEVGISAAQLQQPPQLRQLLLPEVDDATKSLQTSASGSCITQVLHPRLLLSLSVPLAPQKTAAFQKKTDGYELATTTPSCPSQLGFLSCTLMESQ
jgi:hypothetical protein